MKTQIKIFVYTILFIVLIAGATAFGQTETTHPNGHDSDVVNTIVSGGITAANVITGHKPLIPFIPDSILGGAISSIVFFFIRMAEKRRLRRAGKLKDKEPLN